MQMIWIYISEDDKGWRPYFAVIKECGRMNLYLDKAMTHISHSIDLKLWTADSITTSSTQSVHRSFRMTFSTKEGAIRFAFEKEEHRSDFMEKMKPFLENEEEMKKEAKLRTVHWELDDKVGALKAFEDETMTVLVREVRLDDVDEDGVNVEGERVVLKVKGSQIIITIKDEETRNNILDQIRNLIQRRNEMKNIMKLHYPKIELFENIGSGDYCDGKEQKEVEKCGALQRVCAVLDYYSFLMLSPFPEVETKSRNELFEDFMDRYYPKRMFLNDYVHWTAQHREEESVNNLRRYLHFVCDSANQCGATTRHYSDRRGGGGDGKDGASRHWTKEKMDSYHFNIYHLYEVGLRVEGDLSANEMKDIIKMKRSEFSSDRLDGSNNVKFTMNIKESTEATKTAGSDGAYSIYFYFFSELTC